MQRNFKEKRTEGKQLSREDRIARKVELASEDGYAVVPRRALETNAMIALVSKNDYLINRLRLRIGTDDRIDGEKAVVLLKNNRNLRDQMNQQNADLCQVMGMDYKPPRDYEIPQADSKPLQKKTKKKKNTGKNLAPTPVAANHPGRQEVARAEKSGSAHAGIVPGEGELEVNFAGEERSAVDTGNFT